MIVEYPVGKRSKNLIPRHVKQTIWKCAKALSLDDCLLVASGHIPDQPFGFDPEPYQPQTAAEMYQIKMLYQQAKAEAVLYATEMLREADPLLYLQYVHGMQPAEDAAISVPAKILRMHNAGGQ